MWFTDVQNGIVYEGVILRAVMMVSNLKIDQRMLAQGSFTTPLESWLCAAENMSVAVLTLS